MTSTTSSGIAGSAGLRDDAVGAGEPGCDAAACWSRRSSAVRVFVVRLGATARSNVRKPSVAAGPEATGIGVIAPPAGGAGVRPAGMLTPSIGSPKSGRLEQRLLVRARARRVSPRGSRAWPGRAPRRPTTAPVPTRSCAREVAVEPLAVLEEVGVAVLVAGARDERRPLARECLRPIERLRHVRERVAVDEVVARVAAGAEDERVGEVRPTRRRARS